MPFLAAIPAATAIGAAASTAAPIIGGAIGNAAAGDDREAAAAARARALQEILKINAPTIEQQRIALANQSVVGELNPEMLGTVVQDPSHMEGVSTDPRLKEAQMKALSTLQGLGNTGLSTQDRVALMQIRNQTAGQGQAAQEAILQNLAARGMAGGGQELASRMIASQNSANVAGQQGMDIAAQAQNKALQSLIASGQLGGQVRSQEFSEKSDIAKAQDAIQQFNAANRQNVMGTNVSAQNQAQAANLANAQSVANTNTGFANIQEMYNKGLYQKQFQNQMDRAKAASGAENTAAKGFDDTAAATAGMWSNIGQGVGGGVAALANYKPSAPAPVKDVYSDNSPEQGVIGPPKPKKQEGWF